MAFPKAKALFIIIICLYFISTKNKIKINNKNTSTRNNDVLYKSYINYVAKIFTLLLLLLLFIFILFYFFAYNDDDSLVQFSLYVATWTLVVETRLRGKSQGFSNLMVILLQNT